MDWLGCDLVTGRIIEELPDLAPAGGSLSALLGAYTSTSLKLPLGDGHGAPPRQWEAATEPGRTMIVAVLAGQPVWAGIVLVRSGGTDASVELACVSLEGYLERRFVADHTWTGQDEASVIAAGLAGDANDVEGIGLVIDAPATGTPRDRTYADQDDKSVYSALRELMGVEGGPEWTIVLGWTDATQTAVSKTLRIRSRIGHASSSPTAVFTTGSASAVLSAIGTSEARYTYREDHSAGSGANHVIATSSGEGESRPQSTPARDEDLLAPRLGTPTVNDDLGRVVAGSWGTEPATGLAWAIAGGTGANYGADGTTGWIDVDVVNATRRVRLPVSITDVDMLIPVSSDAIALGGNIECSPMLRIDPLDIGGTYLYTEVEFSTTQTVRCRIVRRRASVDTPLTTAYDIPGLTHAAGTPFWIRARAVGRQIMMRVWQDGTSEPHIWHAAATDHTPEAITAPGQIGVRGILDPPNTNPLPVRFNIGSVTVHQAWTGWPRYEHRFSPSSSITDQGTLDAHAAAALALLARGSRILTITARADAYPILGTHWNIGDDIGYDLTGHRHPNGLTDAARAIGWELDPVAGIVTPILLTPGQDVIS